MSGDVKADVVHRFDAAVTFIYITCETSTCRRQKHFLTTLNLCNPHGKVVFVIHAEAIFPPPRSAQEILMAKPQTP